MAGEQAQLVHRHGERARKQEGRIAGAEHRCLPRRGELQLQLRLGRLRRRGSRTSGPAAAGSPSSLASASPRSPLPPPPPASLFSRRGMAHGGGGWGVKASARSCKGRREVAHCLPSACLPARPSPSDHQTLVITSSTPLINTFNLLANLSLPPKSTCQPLYRAIVI